MANRLVGSGGPPPVPTPEGRRTGRRSVVVAVVGGERPEWAASDRSGRAGSAQIAVGPVSVLIGRTGHPEENDGRVAT